MFTVIFILWGFAMVVYDYKFPTLATKLYYHYLKNKNAKDSKMPPMRIASSGR